MGKRSDFKRVERDYYRTFDTRAVPPLLPLLEKDGVTDFIEPFAGSGDLVDQLTSHGIYCLWSSDIEPQDERISQCDAFELRIGDNHGEDVALITNTPWRRDIFHRAIEHFTPLIDCYFLIDANWLFTKQSKPFKEKYVTDIVPIGRLKWIEGSTMSSKDDCLWIKTSRNKDKEIVFHV